MADASGAAGESMVTADGRAVRVVQQYTVRRVQIRTERVLSLPRLLKLVLLWLGIPGGAALAMMLPAGGSGHAFAAGWFVAGLATLALNAAGIVTLRARRRVEVEGDG